MKKNHRRQYLDLWLKNLKGKNEIDPKAFFPALEKKLKGAYSPPTLKRYNAAVLGNLHLNGYISGKKGKTLTGAPLPITRAITFPVLDKCLTRDLGRVTFTEDDLAAVPASRPPVKKVKTPPVKTKTESAAPAAKTGPGEKPRRPRKRPPFRRSRKSPGEPDLPSAQKSRDSLGEKATCCAWARDRSCSPSS